MMSRKRFDRLCGVVVLFPVAAARVATVATSRQKKTCRSLIVSVAV